MSAQTDHNDIVAIQRRLAELRVEIDRARQAAKTATEDAEAIRASIEHERERAAHLRGLA